MAPAVTQLWRLVPSSDIDTTLPDLWREAASENPVSRALMSNLVIVRYGERLPESGLSGLDPKSDIVRIAERHCARVILLNYSPTVGQPCGPGKASVGVLIFGSGAARYGVEAVAVDAVCAEASVPSIVRRLTRGDVPTTVWWTADLSRIQPPDRMVQTGRQLLYDSAGWQDVREGARRVAALVDLPRGPDLADLNWQRLAPLRAAIVHALGQESRATSLLPAGASIRHRAGDEPAAWLIGAWLGRALGWTALPIIEQSDRDDDVVAVTLGGNDWQITACIDGLRVAVGCGGDTPPFSVPVPRRNLEDRVVLELRNLGRDVYLRETMTTLEKLTR